MKKTPIQFEPQNVTDSVYVSENLELRIHNVPAQVHSSGEVEYAQDVFQRLDHFTRTTLEQNPDARGVLEVDFKSAPLLESEAKIANPVSLEITRAIRESGLTHAQLAERMGVSRPLVTRWTHPQYHGHTVETLERLARALGKVLEVRMTDAA